MKMVIVTGIAGKYDKEKDDIVGVEIAPYGRLILKDDKIVGEVLSIAKLPDGYMVEGIKIYQRWLNNYIFQREFYDFVKPYSMLYGVDAINNPELYLYFLHKVYPECSEFREWDDNIYAALPLGKVDFLNKLRKKTEKEQDKQLQSNE